MRKNYRLRDLLLTSEESQLLSDVGFQLGMKPTDLARLLLRERITEIKARVAAGETFSIGLFTMKGGKKHGTR